jgi:raffinose/stachyose/melibiose transport system substrate-binding protein
MRTPTAGPGITRRSVLQGGLLAAGALALPGLLAACSTGGGAAGGGDEKGPLNVWWWGEQEAPGLKRWMNSTVAAYNAAGKDRAGKVTPVLQQSDTLYTAFRTAAQSKTGPDVQYFWGGTQALEDVWMGHVAPLDKVLPKSFLDRAPMDSRRETYWDGHQWGLPFYEVNTAFAYNKKMFAAAGLDPEKPPVTWDEFITALTALKKKGFTPLGAGFKDAYLGGWLVSYFGAQEFDSVEDAISPFKGDVAYAGEKYTGWLDRIKELIDRKFFNDDVLSLNLYQGQQLFQDKKVAITNSVQPQVVGFERALGADTVGVMLAPVWGSGKLAHAFTGASQVLTVTSFSHKASRAARFLEYLREPAVMKAMYEASGAISPDAKFDPAWLNTETDKRMAQLQKQLPSFWFQYYYPFPFENNGVTPGVQQLFQGGSVATAQKMLTDAIAKWKKQQPNEVAAYKKWELLK